TADLGGTMRLGAQRVLLEPSSRVAEIYGRTEIWERHRHRYEINPAYLQRFREHGLLVSGRSVDGRVEALEITDHPFFVGVQYHPEFLTRPEAPHPLYLELEEYRALGGVAFALVRDRSGSTPVTLKKGVADPKLFDLLSTLPRESVIEVHGTVQTSAKAKRGVELLPEAVEVVSTAAVPLPLGIVDKVGAELDTRLNHRVLDLRKPSVQNVFHLRAALLDGFRQTFHERGYVEVETPKLLRQGAEGGATLFPVQYFDQRAFLAQSPQLYKQMLMGAGFERVFEIAPAFRAEPSDTVRHITEFTSLDAELAYIDGAEEVRHELEHLVVGALRHAKKRLLSHENPIAERIPDVAPPFARFPFAEVERWLGRPGAQQDLGTEDEKRVGEIALKEHGAAFYFITDFPTAVKAHTFYARRRDDDPALTGYFDLDFQGLELASGGPREHRLEQLLQNIASAGLRAEDFPGYLEAFRYGMPPHGGWGFGVDRLVWSLAQVANIREARLFPRDRYRLDP
ncbi:MAG: aspartate--tRNA(Asn) ligase, partial [Thermoplasmata archaeon]|nr:aspartate--tRNA(Asn) ligase [Thermoplasmata archaeon]